MLRTATRPSSTRRGLIRRVHQRIEEGRVAVRNIRRDALEQLRDLKKDGGIGDDQVKRIEADIQKMTDRHIESLAAIQATKEAELLEV